MSEVLKIPPEAQESFMQMQMFQQQMQNVVMQRETLHVQKMEGEKALDELGKLKDSDEVFKAVGPILIKAKKSDLEKELKDKMETIDVRMSTLEKQEVKIREKAEEIQKKLEELLNPAKGNEKTAG